MACQPSRWCWPDSDTAEQASIFTVLLVQGWLFYFYEDQADEPIHVHAAKGNAECRFWLHPARFDIEEDFGFNMSPHLRREIRQLLFERFDEIVEAWEKWSRGTAKRHREADPDSGPFLC